VNGSSQNITFSPTGSWDVWVTQDVVVTLNAGTSNTIRLQSTGQDLANQDEMTVVGSATTDPTPTVTVTSTPTEPPSGSMTMMGADVSTLQRSQELGQKYYDANGVEQEPLVILKNLGVNYIRLRVWVNPISGYNNKEKILQYAQQVKANGLKLMIDFHYSDTWADPGKQYKPAAWASHNISQLQTDVYNHTYDVCSALKAQGTTPDSIQIGNEINMGMLWDDGKIINNNFTNLGLLLKQGYNAVKACNSSTQVIIHTATVESDSTARWFYDGIRNQGVSWDITGLSYYCFWHGSMSNMTSVVSDMISRYGKPVVIAETAYPFTTADADAEPNVISSSSPCSGYQATWTGQANNFAAVQAAAKSGGAIGVFYWEPTWVAIDGNGWDPADINGTGDGWDNMAIFDWSGNINPNVHWNP